MHRCSAVAFIMLEWAGSGSLILSTTTVASNIYHHTCLPSKLLAAFACLCPQVSTTMSKKVWGKKSLLFLSPSLDTLYTLYIRPWQSWKNFFTSGTSWTLLYLYWISKQNKQSPVFWLQSAFETANILFLQFYSYSLPFCVQLWLNPPNAAESKSYYRLKA